MNFSLILEVTLFEAVCLLPFLVLAYLPFRFRLRYSKKLTTFLISILFLLLVFSRIAAIGNQTVAALMSVFWIFIYLIFYRISIRAELSRLLFLLLTLLNYGSVVSVLSSWIVFQRLPASMSTPYSVSYSLITAALIAVSYYPVRQLLVLKMEPLICNPDTHQMWRILWVVPATFCLSYYYNLFANGGIISFSVNLSNVLFAIGLNIGALIVTRIVVVLLADSNERLRLKAENYQLSTQSLQYTHLKSRMEEAQRARHDLKQNMTVIQSFLQDNNVEGLRQYLSQYAAVLPCDTPIRYCENYAVNALIVFYEGQARSHGIRFAADVHYDNHTGIPDTDAIVLLGNLLENAVEACQKQITDSSRIELKVKMIQRSIVITLDNTYNGPLNRSGAAFTSGKGKGHGIGITSIIKIAERYGGTAQFQGSEELFQASVLLYPPQTEHSSHLPKGEFYETHD